MVKVVIDERYPVAELKRKPKEGDECVCGAPFEDGQWWSNFINRTHDGRHKPWRFGSKAECEAAEDERWKAYRASTEAHRGSV